MFGILDFRGKKQRQWLSKGVGQYSVLLVGLFSHDRRYMTKIACMGNMFLRVGWQFNKHTPLLQ